MMRAFESLSRFAVYPAMLVVAAMMLLTVADVTGRYVFSRPVTGTMEITEYMMVCLLLGMATCALEKRHISVNLITNRLSTTAQAIMEIITLLVGLSLVIILAWQGIEAGLFAVAHDLKSSMLKVPDFPFYVVLTVGFSVLCLSMVVLLVQRVVELAKR